MLGDLTVPYVLGDHSPLYVAHLPTATCSRTNRSLSRKGKRVARGSGGRTANGKRCSLLLRSRLPPLSCRVMSCHVKRTFSVLKTRLPMTASIATTSPCTLSELLLLLLLLPFRFHDP